jgi:hypothetical protein
MSGAAHKQPPGESDPQITILVGQLLATTNSIKEGLIEVNREQQANSRAILSAANTMEVVERTVDHLVALVKDGNGQESLVSQTKELRLVCRQLRLELDAIVKVVEDLKFHKAATSAQADGKRTAWSTILSIVSLITAAIAATAAVWKLRP